MAAMKVRAIDQKTAHARGAHFSEGNLLRAGGHALSSAVRPPEQVFAGSSTARDARCTFFQACLAAMELEEVVLEEI